MLGAHVSIKDGLPLAPGRGRELGCEAIQIFSKNQRQWKARPLMDEEAEAFKEAVKKEGIGAVTIHDSYLINLADPVEETLQKSRVAFIEEMERAQRLGVPHLIFHPGAHKEAGVEFGIKRIAESLDYCIKESNAPDVTLLIECTAGQGSVLGHTFEQLKDIRSQAAAEDRVGYCFDTCHLFAAGYDLRAKEGYDAVMEYASLLLGLDNVRAFHLNDSKRELGSHVDRHENIGEGQLGLEAFRMLVNDSRFRKVPMVLETPGDDDDYKRDLDLLKRLQDD